MSSRAALHALRIPGFYQLFASRVISASRCASHFPLERQYPLPREVFYSSFHSYSPVPPMTSFSSRVGGSQHFCAESVPAASKVVVVRDDAHYSEVMKDVKSKDALGVVYFTAQWCGPCKQIAPYIDVLSQQFDDVVFIKLDVDKVALEKTMVDSHIGVVPTFHFHKKGELVGELTGAVRDKLKNLIVNLRSKS